MTHSCAARAPLNAGQKSSLCSHVMNHCLRRPNEACNLWLLRGTTRTYWALWEHCSTSNVASTQALPLATVAISIALTDPVGQFSMSVNA